MIAWDTTDIDKIEMVVFCDSCGEECTCSFIEVGKQQYCKSCEIMFSYMNSEDYYVSEED